MKKLLSLLSSVVLAAVGATTVVACSAPTTNIEVTLADSKYGTFDTSSDGNTYTFHDGGSDDKHKVNYSKSELNAAMNGNSYANLMNQNLPVAMTFDELNLSMLNVLSFNRSLVVKTQNNMEQLRDFRNAFLGRDKNENTTNGIGTPSVDGIRFSEFDGSDPADYYKLFQNTDINSLTGLKEIYEYGSSNADNLSKLTGKALEAYNTAKTLFGDSSSAGSQLMKDFANSKENPAFTKISYDMPLTIYHSQSQMIDGFNTSEENQDLSISSKIGKYSDNNPNATDSKSDSNSISDHQESDPFASVIIDPDNGAHAKNGAQDLQIKTKSFSNKTDEYKKGKSDQLLSEYFSKMSDDNSADSVSYFVGKDGNNKDKFIVNQNIGEYVVKKVNPITVKYTYDTNVDLNDAGKKAKDNKTYTISFDLNNLAEVFTPFMTGVNGPALSSVNYDKDKTLTLKFSGVDFTKNSDLQKTLQIGGAAITGDLQKVDPKNSDTLVYKNASYSAKSDITFSNNKKSSDANMKYSYDFANPTETTYSTSQLVWLFRGYKFLDYDKLSSDSTTEKFVDKDGSTGMPVRNDNLGTDIKHSLRDLDTGNWKIS